MKPIIGEFMGQRCYVTIKANGSIRINIRSLKRVKKPRKPKS